MRASRSRVSGVQRRVLDYVLRADEHSLGVLEACLYLWESMEELIGDERPGERCWRGWTYWSERSRGAPRNCPPSCSPSTAVV